MDGLSADAAGNAIGSRIGFFHITGVVLYFLDQKIVCQFDCMPFLLLFFSFLFVRVFYFCVKYSSTLNLTKYSNKSYFILLMMLKSKSLIIEGSISNSLIPSFNKSWTHFEFLIKITLDSWNNWLLFSFISYKYFTCGAFFCSIFQYFQGLVLHYGACRSFNWLVQLVPTKLFRSFNSSAWDFFRDFRIFVGPFRGV